MTQEIARLKILVIDDDPAVLGVMDEHLNACGYTVLLAQSGAAALEVISRVPPDLVLVDALMPGMTGWDICKTLRVSAKTSGIPIIFMTGLTETEHVLRAFEAGAVDYVTKPLRLEEVTARVGVHIEAAARIRAAHAVLDNAGRCLLAVNRAGALVWATPQAGLLAEALEIWPLALPETLPAVGTILQKIGRNDEQIFLTLVGAVAEDEILLRISSQPLSPEKIFQEKLGLSTRESEVLLWISRGKTSRDIADILQVSPRTIDKHIEQIYNKTGLSTRSAAAATASRLLQE